jgi:hypothetical protein
MRFTKCFLTIVGQTLFSFIFFLQYCIAQDTEFPKGFIMHAKLHNGMVTDFKQGADLYVGGVQLVPQFTLIEHKLRAGIVAGAFYGGKVLEGQFGLNTSVKIKTIDALVFGGAANINLSAEHLWGTGKQKLIGGGINIDVLNKIVLAMTAHRDYEFKTWWLQMSLGIRVSKKKKIKEKFNE